MPLSAPIKLVIGVLITTSLPLIITTSVPTVFGSPAMVMDVTLKSTAPVVCERLPVTSSPAFASTFPPKVTWPSVWLTMPFIVT